MIGGTRRPEVAHYHDTELETLAKQELKYTLGITSVPHHVFVKIWRKGIPQFTPAYCEVRKILDEKLQENQNLYFAANFWNGISFNDCIENAHNIADNIDLNKLTDN
jgi:oxygen-dependent protoporphyrinogen oxidase